MVAAFAQDCGKSTWIACTVKIQDFLMYSAHSWRCIGRWKRKMMLTSEQTQLCLSGSFEIILLTFILECIACILLESQGKLRKWNSKNSILRSILEVQYEGFQDKFFSDFWNTSPSILFQCSLTLGFSLLCYPVLSKYSFIPRDPIKTTFPRSKYTHHFSLLPIPYSH